MKKNLIGIFVLLAIALQSNAQTFINKGVIEYEVKTNIKKTLGGGPWAEMMKDNISQFKTGYYKLTFSGDKSIYKFDRWQEGMKMPEFLRKSDEDNSWYFDHSAGTYTMQKNIFGSNFNIQDSIRNISWKLSAETRIIAGYNCRKAVGVIMDSVYIFAFYTDEITLSGGPCSITGLPGTILGLTIPRMYTSFIATKITPAVPDEKVIKPITAKKYMTNAAMKSFLTERIKGEVSSEDEDSKSFVEQLYWSTQL